MIKFLILLVLFSCAHKPTGGGHALDSKTIEEKRNQIGVDMWNVDSRLRAKLLRDEKYSDFLAFNKLTYVQKVKEHQLPSEKEYVDFLSAQDLEILLVGQKRNFTVCAQSKSHSLVFCDRADTAKLEYSTTGGTHDLNELIKNYL